MQLDEDWEYGIDNKLVTREYKSWNSDPLNDMCRT